MGVIDVLWHVIGFLMPAACVAVVMAFSGRFFKPNKPIAGGLIAQTAILFIVCVIVLIAGLLITGRDGKMLTYLAMVAAAGVVQWLQSGGWRR